MPHQSGHVIIDALNAPVPLVGKFGIRWRDVVALAIGFAAGLLF